MKLSEFLNDLGRPVAYYPGLAIALGDAKEAIFLCQMSYWRGKEQDAEGWIYKESAEITRETGLSYKEQINVRKGLLAKKLMVERYARTEHRMYFQIDWDAVNNWWEGHLTDGHMPKRKVAPAKRSDASLPKGNWHITEGRFPICPFVISLNGIAQNTSQTTPETTKESDAVFISKVWDRVLDLLQRDLPRASYEYVKDSRAIRYDRNAITIAVRSDDARDWLADRLTSTVRQLLIGILGAQISVAFVVADPEVTA